MTNAVNPTILGSGGLGKVMYEAFRMSTEQFGGDAMPPWDMADASDRAHWITTAGATIDFMHDARLLDKRYAQLRRGTGTVLPSQRP